MATAEKKPFERLPTKVVPKHYDLHITPDLNDLTFLGRLSVVVTVKEQTDVIKLNSVDIKVSACHFKGAGGTLEGKVEYDETAETVSAVFTQQLAVGEGSLELEYAGNLNGLMKGFYRSKYTTPSGEERYAGVTQFEPTDARRALPCWDEPALKATFGVTLCVPKDRTALSNMPEKSVKDLGEKREIVFETTPIMSTYLLAFIVGEFEFVEEKDKYGVLHRVYTPLGKKEQGRWALEVSVKSLAFYREYFDIPYPLLKMDLIAIADFAAGAMENWGLVTYRERLLLIDPQQSSLMTKRRVALVVAHELAHQWFGNLVTMEWWTHLWLNEGFATFMQYHFTHLAYPEYDIWTLFVDETLSSALALDGMASSHPIEVPVGHPSEIDEIFDIISYHKGSSVLRMLHNYIGDDDFKKGLNQYLTKFSYKNAETEDLWASLEAASGKPIQKVMPSWTRQMGYPVISVSAEGDGDDLLIDVSQKKFNLDGTESDPKHQWVVPIGVATDTNPLVCNFLLDSPKDQQRLKNVVKEANHVKLNPQHNGFYRVSYSEGTFGRILQDLLKMTPSDRLGVLNDQMALARGAIANTTQCLDLIKAIGSQEENYVVWVAVDKSVGTFEAIFEQLGQKKEFSKFVQGLYDRIFKTLGFDAKEGESVLNSMLRPLVLSRLGKHGHPEVLARFREKFKLHCAGTAAIPADLRACIYSAIARHGGEEAYNDLIKLYEAGDLAEEKVRLLQCASQTGEGPLLMKVLDYSRSDKVRHQDLVSVLWGGSDTQQGLSVCYDYFKKNYQWYYENFKGIFLMSSIIGACTGGFMTLERADDVKAFFDTHPCEGGERKVQQSIEQIRIRAKWVERDGEKVKEWLAKEASK